MAIKVNSDTKSLKFQKKRLWVQYTSHIFRAYMKKPSSLGTSFLRTVGIRMEWYGSFDSPDTPPNCKTKRALALTAKAFLGIQSPTLYNAPFFIGMVHLFP